MSLNDENESSMSNLENVDERNDAKNESTADYLNKDFNQTNDYNFGWNRYSEITNGRFAMIGFFSILIIEMLSKKSFFSWTGF